MGGLQQGEVLTVFPVFQAFFIGFGVVGGMIFYQQSSKMSGLDWGMNVLGGVFMLIGFALLISSAQRVQREVTHTSSSCENLPGCGGDVRLREPSLDEIMSAKSD